MSQARRRFGASGEELAAAWYAARGYDVVARNWRCREGELDLVVRLDRTLVFAEVKNRASDRYGLPAEAVTRTKQQRIRRLAARFLAGAPEPVATVRFDVVAILGGRIQVYEGVF